MSISMLIKSRLTEPSEEIPVCTNTKWISYWLRAAEEMGLEMIQALSALWVTAEFRDRFLNELAILKAWATGQSETDEYLPEMADRIDAIVQAITTHSLDEYEVSFG